MAVDVGEKLEETALIPGEAQVPPADTMQTGETPNGESPGTLGSKLLKPQTIVSFLIALAIMVFFYKRLDISPGEVWDNLKAANPWYFMAGRCLLRWHGATRHSLAMDAYRGRC